jgi:hypothetical protein
MTWNEFKNFVDSKLTEDERNTKICFIDLDADIFANDNPENFISIEVDKEDEPNLICIGWNYKDE